MKAAADCGLDAELTRAARQRRGLERVEREANAAKEAGIDGVPCFIFGGVVAVPGAQVAGLSGGGDRAGRRPKKRQARRG